MSLNSSFNYKKLEDYLKFLDLKAMNGWKNICNTNSIIRALAAMFDTYKLWIYVYLFH